MPFDIKTEGDLASVKVKARSMKSSLQPAVLSVADLMGWMWRRPRRSMVSAAASRKSRWSVQEHRHEWTAAGARSRPSKRDTSGQFPIYPAYALHFPIGPPNYACCRARLDSMRIRSRIERLEDQMPLPAGPPIKLNIMAVNAEGKDFLAQVFEVPQIPPLRRGQRYRGFPARRDP
jgi:hypothetical protein